MTTAPPLLNNPNAPDVFADSAVGFFNFNGNMRITFEAVHSDYTTNPPGIDRVVIGRLVMPVAAAEAMARSVLDLVEKMKAEPGPITVSVQ
ncbi:hypothetical protein IHQ71_04365 [Rhizobium sp. TH2]|uniref:hypothetical protein n=1 Tax=Rhizobium sp. TH2 TaxID=2775403 RepID=UPI0021589732|nr:hypothetical protein [Rhizobium sp. TH2]UVC09854.1 hypothetical protein IHQ71_04365 [Rhizobium sp. TH2]